MGLIEKKQKSVAKECGKRVGGVGARIHSSVKYLTRGTLNEHM